MPDKNSATSPDRRKWVNAQRNLGKDSTRTVTTFDARREQAVIMARIYIQRENLLTGDMSEQCYLATLCCYIREFGFNADILRVTETRFAGVLAAGKKLPGQTG